ncbi:RPL3 [Symbiodinium necroappetens]|uniref:RPL3 protein n=1 Tax=Symbiodinium necroappetens TaxID=1628268 RepID=A0A812MB11_9DINO|nr:RPL3 [Symbiodinium necroappetens]
MESRIKSKQLEAKLLKDKVQEARLKAQQLRLQLKAIGAQDTVAGSGSEEPSEFRELLEMLVGAVDLQRQVLFECGSEGEVQVGGRRVMLHRMVTWQMGDSPLKLSVPMELQAEIAGLLTDARKRGRMEEAVLQRLSSTWELMGAEVVSASGSGAGACPSAPLPEPAIFLVHRSTSQAVVVAKWPAVDFTQSEAPKIFDPESHFSRPLNESATTNISTGDRVEVEYEARGMVHRPLGLQSMAAAVDFLDCNVAWRKMCAFPALLGLSARGGFRVVALVLDCLTSA